MFKKFLFLTLVSAFVLTLSHCTKKEGAEQEKQFDVQKLKESLDVADQEMGKMIDQISDMGFQNKDQMTQMLEQFKNSSDKFEKYKLCSSIVLAKASYELRGKVNKSVPALTGEQVQIIKNAEQHCQWASNAIKQFEGSLSDQDFKTIAGDVPNSLVPYRKSLFSTNKCDTKEYTNLLQKDRNLYTDTKVLGAVLIMSAIQVDGNMKEYIPNYKGIVAKSDFAEKDFLLKFLDHAAESKDQVRDLEQKKQSLIRATKAFSEAGIESIPKFLVQSVSTAPKCFSSVNSGLIDIAKLVSTGDRMKLMYVRLANEVKKSGNLPELEPVEKTKTLKNINTQFLDQLVKEKIATRDKWFRPFMISGDKNSFQIVSAGKDRTPGTADDIIYPDK